jgi:toxin ParE1/3/4
MPVLHISELAEQDLREVVLPIALADLAAARRFLEQVDERYKLLARFPELGRERPDLAPDIRICPIIKHYVIAYRALPNGVAIARFLDGRRDLHALL